MRKALLANHLLFVVQLLEVEGLDQYQLYSKAISVFFGEKRQLSYHTVRGEIASTGNVLTLKEIQSTRHAFSENPLFIYVERVL